MSCWTRIYPILERNCGSWSDLSVFGKKTVDPDQIYPFLEKKLWILIRFIRFWKERWILIRWLRYLIRIQSDFHSDWNICANTTGMQHVKGLKLVRSVVYKTILRDFRNAPFYIHCLFHMTNLRMFSLSFFILLQNGPWFAMVSFCSCCSFWRNIDESDFQQLSCDKFEFDSIWKQTLLGGSQMS